jgi:hypothetical protein
MSMEGELLVQSGADSMIAKSVNLLFWTSQYEMGGSKAFFTKGLEQFSLRLAVDFSSQDADMLEQMRTFCYCCFALLLLT